MQSDESPILITGASGFIGRRLVRRLAADGRRVRAFVLPGEVTGDLWPVDAAEIHRGDITDPAAVAAATTGAGAVIHLAAVVGDAGPEALHRQVTVGGTAHALHAATRAGVRRFVLVSSIVVYGDALGRDRCDEAHPFGRALGAYSRAKQAQERLARRAARIDGLPLVVVRPANVYGPGSGPWVHSVMEMLRAGMPALISGGDQNAGLVFVDNVVDLIARAAQVPEALGGTYNAVDPEPVSWREYFGALARHAGCPVPRSLPRALATPLAHACEAAWAVLRRTDRPPLTREALNLVGSHHRLPLDRARQELAYTPPVSYADGLAQTLEYVTAAGL